MNFIPALFDIFTANFTHKVKFVHRPESAGATTLRNVKRNTLVELSPEFRAVVYTPRPPIRPFHLSPLQLTPFPPNHLPNHKTDDTSRGKVLEALAAQKNEKGSPPGGKSE